MGFRIALLALVALATALVALPAHGYDMDCKVILCLAGGFPTGCADARAYMLRRLRATPPKPPFGECAAQRSSGFHAVRGRETHFPCAHGFEMRGARCGPHTDCVCVCEARTRSARSAAILAERAANADGGTYPGASVLVPSREEDRDHYEVRYQCRRRPNPNWIMIRIRSHDGQWFVSERHWWR